MEWFTICRNNGQRKRLFYTWFFTGSLLHCYLKHIIKRCHRHVYRALPQTCCVVWHWIKDDEMTRRSEVCSIIIFGNEQEWGVRLDGAIQRERERERRESQMKDLLNGLLTIWIHCRSWMQRVGIYIYCFENSDMMAINQLEERQAEESVTVHAMGQVKWGVINTEGTSVWW